MKALIVDDDRVFRIYCGAKIHKIAGLLGMGVVYPVHLVNQRIDIFYPEGLLPSNSYG